MKGFGIGFEVVFPAFKAYLNAQKLAAVVQAAEEFAAYFDGRCALVRDAVFGAGELQRNLPRRFKIGWVEVYAGWFDGHRKRN